MAGIKEDVHSHGGVFLRCVAQGSLRAIEKLVAGDDDLKSNFAQLPARAQTCQNKFRLRPSGCFPETRLGAHLRSTGRARRGKSSRFVSQSQSEGLHSSQSVFSADWGLRAYGCSEVRDGQVDPLVSKLKWRISSCQAQANYTVDVHGEAAAQKYGLLQPQSWATQVPD